MKKFEIVLSALLSRIEVGALRPGDRIPTEKELCTEFAVSRITAMRAVKELEKAGRVSRTPGRGSFVSEAKAPSLPCVSLILPMINRGYYSDMADGFCSTLKEQNAIGMVQTDNYNPAYTTELITQLKNQGTHGLGIVPSGKTAVMDRLLPLIEKVPFPVVIGSRSLKGFSGHQIIVDEEQAGYRSATYLHSIGHKRIAYAGSTRGYSSSELRYQGFRRAVETLKLKPEDCPLLGNIDPLALPALKAQFSGRKGPTAIVSADEAEAIQLFDLLNALGIDVPKRTAMLSLDGGQLAPAMTVPLTTLDFPGREIGIQIAIHLLKRCRAGGAPGSRGKQGVDDKAGRVTRIEAALTVRQSCGAKQSCYRHEFLRDRIQQEIK